MVKLAGVSYASGAHDDLPSRILNLLFAEMEVLFRRVHLLDESAPQEDAGKAIKPVMWFVSLLMALMETLGK